MKRRAFSRWGLAFVGLLWTLEVFAQLGNPGHLAMLKGASAGGGVPTGNSFTIVLTNLLNSTANGIAPGGNVGDLIVACYKWEGSGITLNWMSNDVNGVMTLLGGTGGAVVSPAGDMRCHIATVVASSVSQLNVTVNHSGGSPSFQDWAVFRVRASGTITVGSGASGNGTGTAVTAGTYTTAAQNGCLIGMSAPDGSATHSSFTFGGQAAIQYAIPSSSTSAFSYLHTAQQSSANFLDTLGTSRNWVSKVVSITAQ